MRPTKSRLEFATTADGYRLTIPTKRYWAFRILGPFWLVAWWGSAVAFIVVSFQGGPDWPPVGLMLPVLLFWIIFSGLYSYWILWQIAGKEIVTIAGGQMTIKRDVLGFGRTRAYPVAQIRNLRASGLFGSFYSWSGMMKLYGFKGGVVAFENGDTTQRFGVHLEEPEALQVVENLQAHLR
jgi:hypothetical protein